MFFSDFFYQDDSFSLKISIPSDALSWNHPNFLQKKPLEIIEGFPFYSIFITFGIIDSDDLFSDQDFSKEYIVKKFSSSFDLSKSFFNKFKKEDFFHPKFMVFRNFPNLRCHVIDNNILFFLFLNCENIEKFLYTLDDKLLLFISNIKHIWLISNNGFKIHSSAIVNRNKGYIFLGKSGAGKSTAAELSISRNGNLINTDQNSIFFKSEKGYVVSPSDNLAKNTPVKAFFNVIQSDNNFLEPINKLDATNLIFQAFLQNGIGLTNFSDKLVELAFQNARILASLIPAYNLYFTKSPDFWDLIDAEFGD